jgi:hypothetical protein
MQATGLSWATVRPMADMLHLPGTAFSTAFQGVLHEVIIDNFHTLNADTTTSKLDSEELALALATKEGAVEMLAAMERRAGDNSHLVGNDEDDRLFVKEMSRLSWPLHKLPNSRQW